MTYLRKTYDELKQELIDALEGEGFPYNPLTTEFTAFLSTALGNSSAYLRESLGKLLADLDAQYGGSLSERYVTIAHLMDDAVANIGAGGGGGGGEGDDDMTLLASGAITAATAEVQLALPTGYWAYTLRLMGIVASDQDNITIQFSSDDGETWHEGVADYKILTSYANPGSDNGSALVRYFEDNQGYIIYDAKPDPSAGVASSAVIHIDPGFDGVAFPQLRSDAFDQQSGNFPSITTFVVVCVAERARQNRIRFQTYIGDGRTLEGGAYALYGVPVA